MKSKPAFCSWLFLCLVLTAVPRWNWYWDTVGTAISSSDGSFSFTGLTTSDDWDDFQLLFTKEGYRFQQSNVISLNAGDTAYVEVTLVPLGMGISSRSETGALLEQIELKLQGRMLVFNWPFSQGRITLRELNGSFYAATPLRQGENRISLTRNCMQGLVVSLELDKVTRNGILLR
jgi:hypothetical protein